MESVIVLILLVVIFASIGKFAAHVNQGIQRRWLALQLQWELNNAREIIGSWAVPEVTQSRIEKLGVSAELAELLENPRWSATVQPQLLAVGSIDNQTGLPSPAPAAQSAPSRSVTVPATAVRLQLQAGFLGQQIKPVELVFWLLAEENVQQATSSADSTTDSASLSSPKSISATDESEKIP